jgi:hypothetical protein
MAAMTQADMDSIFFTYIDGEEAAFPRHASIAARGVDHLIERCKAFERYLSHQPLPPTQRRELLDAYEAYVLIEMAYQNTSNGSA